MGGASAVLPTIQYALGINASKEGSSATDPLKPEYLKKGLDTLQPESIKQMDIISNYNDTSGGGDLPVPEVPSIESAQQTASKKVENRLRAIRSGKTQTVFSSLGLGGVANLARKYLLGE